MLRSSPVVAATARRERARVTRRGSDGVPWPTAGIRRAGRGVCRQGMTAASGRVSVLVSSNRCSPDKGRGALVLGQSRDRPTRSSALCGARHGSQRLRSPQPGVTRHRRHVRQQAMRLQRGWSWMVCWRPRRRGREVVGGWAPAISSIRWATLAEPRSSHSACRSGRWQSPLRCRPAAGQHAEVVPTSWQPPGPINVAIESCADQRERCRVPPGHVPSRDVGANIRRPGADSPRQHAPPPQGSAACGDPRLGIHRRSGTGVLWLEQGPHTRSESCAGGVADGSDGWCVLAAVRVAVLAVDVEGVGD
jgi:hypothetical protein